MGSELLTAAPRELGLEIKMTNPTLWIENTSLNSFDIREACAPAEVAITTSGFTIREAYDASMAEADGREFNQAAAAAWQNAERVALANVADESAILSIA